MHSIFILEFFFQFPHFEPFKDVTHYTFCKMLTAKNSVYRNPLESSNTCFTPKHVQ